MSNKLKKYIRGNTDFFVFIIVVVGTLITVLINPSNFVTALLLGINLIIGLIDIVKNNNKIKFLVAIVLLLVSYLILDEINIITIIDFLV